MDQKLLISASLLRAISKEEKNISTYELLGEFIKYSIGTRSSLEFNDEECSAWLKSDFSFEIPIALIRSVTKNLIKRSELNATIINGTYKLAEKAPFDNDLENSKTFEAENYRKINNALIEYKSKIEIFNNISDESAKNALISFLSKEGINDNEQALISSFIIIKNNDPEISEILKKIEEGLLLYSGIKYTSVINKIGKWPSKLQIFLDTEYLFNIGGLNGEIFLKIFNQFNELVKESNRGNKEGRITIHYFREAREDIERFFSAAESIAANEMAVKDRKQASNGCVNI